MERFPSSIGRSRTRNAARSQCAGSYLARINPTPRHTTPMTTASMNIGENSSMSMGESPRQTRLTFDAANTRESIGRRIAGGRYRGGSAGQKRAGRPELPHNPDGPHQSKNAAAQFGGCASANMRRTDRKDLGSAYRPDQAGGCWQRSRLTSLPHSPSA